ncbi:MAG: hypothetical protein AAF568_02525, partial [Pseudomonadota bacterium]
MTRLLAGFLAVLLISVALGQSARAQIPDYSILFGGQSSGPQSTPQQSSPLPTPGQAPVGIPPSAEDYAQLDLATDPMLGAAKNAVEVFRLRLTETLRHTPKLWRDLRTTWALASPTKRPRYFLGVALFGALLLMVGRGVLQLYAAFIARPLFIAAQKPNPEGYLDKLPVLAYRMFLTLVGCVIMLGVASAIGLYFYQEHEPTLLTIIALFSAYTILQIIDTLWRMTLSPLMPEYRLVSLNDRQARVLYRWLVAGSAIGVFGIAFIYWLEALGMPERGLVLIGILMNLATVGALLAMMRVNRRAIRQLILAGKMPTEASWITLLASKLWAPVGAIYLIVAWGKMSFDLIMGIETNGKELIVPYLVLIIGLLAYAVTSYLIERVFTHNRRVRDQNRAMAEARAASEEAARDAEMTAEHFGASDDIDGDGDEEGATKAVPDRPLLPVGRRGMKTFEDLARRIASLFALGAAAWVMVYYWGGPEIYAESALFGIAQDLFDILFIGYILYHSVR